MGKINKNGPPRPKYNKKIKDFLADQQRINILSLPDTIAKDFKISPDEAKQAVFDWLNHEGATKV